MGLKSAKIGCSLLPFFMLLPCIAAHFNLVEFVAAADWLVACENEEDEGDDERRFVVVTFFSLTFKQKCHGKKREREKKSVAS